jgi:hypothetical protein
MGLWGLELPAATAQTPRDYWQQIDDIQELVSRLEGEPLDVQRARLAAAAAQLTLVTVVSLPNGREVPINHTFLLNELSRDPPDLDRLQNLLTAWQAARTTWPEAQFAEWDEAALQTILSQPEFQYEIAEPTRLQRWLEDLQLRFWQWLSEIFPSFSTEGGIGNIANFLVTAVGILVLIVVLVYALRQLLGDFASESAIRPEDHLGDEIVTADTALQRAQQFSGEGDYRTAVRYLYLSALLLLEEKGLLRYNRSLTNHEYLRSLAHQPELAAVLHDIIEVFDRVWYGFHALEPTEYEWYAGRVELLKRQRRQRE